MGLNDLFLIVDFFINVPYYIVNRLNALTIFVTNTINNILINISDSKFQIISRLFWGRGNFYKNVTHFLLIVLTSFIAITGFVTKIHSLETSPNKLLAGNSQFATNDLLQQGGSLETVLVSDPNASGLKFSTHIVSQGDTLPTIAKQYGLTIDTIRWANRDLVSPFTNDIKIGWTLKIPEINGVLYTIKPNQTMANIIYETGGNEFDIAEFNNLQQPYNLAAGTQIFIPDGNFFRPDVTVTGIPRGVFINPLSNPACRGYVISRGFLSYHNGVDMARWPGCPISAVANGYVTYAGKKNYGEGYMVEIDHGGGIVTHYYHGDGTYFVKSGDRVQQGQPIMMMGCTGNCTGTHLHFTLFKDRVAVDPKGFVPY